MIQAGYREGITDGKLQTLQEGFDSAFAFSVPSSRRIGQLRGRVNALLNIATSSSSPEVLSEVREIAAELGAVRRDEVLPPDQERIAHEEEHGEVDEVINPTDQREMEGLEAALGGLGGKKDGLREEALIEDLERRVGEVEKKVLHL